jgi:glucose/arabinose dehydrogenase
MNILKVNKKALIFLFGGIGALIFISFKSGIPVQEPWKAPDSADTIKSPFPFTPQVIREGEKLYTMLCVSCHGASGLGDGQPGRYKIPPANFHSKQVTDQKDGALFWKLTHGKGNMPAYGVAFNEEKRWQLVAYIRQFAKQDLNATVSKPVLPLKNYRFDKNLSNRYFPIPAKVSNVYSSEEQLFMVDTVVKDLVRPWSIVFMLDNSVLIAERSGKLLKVKDGKVQANPIGGNVPTSLRDVKLHPDFEKNRLIYFSYFIEPTTPGTGYTALMRGKLIGDKLTEEKMIYKAGPFKRNGDWFGSKIGFDDKGFLYFTVGIHTADRMNSQNLSAPDGKTMRLNDDGSIPKDNPFINTPGALPEIYSYGHRMHQGFRRDPKTGRIFFVEFGELAGDELNILKRGANYGWPLATFSLEYNGSIISESPYREGTEPPIHHYAIAPSDLDFVYGTRYPAWNGNIFIGGLATKKLYRLVMKDDKSVHDEAMLHNLGRIRDVKYGPDQFLYVLTEDTGILVRLIPLSKI